MITIHRMKLYPKPFNLIKSGSKTIEMRLNDEKRSIIIIGDKIEFTNTETNEIILCDVINLYKYKNFEELYKHHSKESIGYLPSEDANPSDMLSIYSNEKINKYGVLGIELSILK